jgi:AcrR family transcriptional regulator
MARTFNQSDYDNKRREILLSVRKLIFTMGYDQMSIQDILNDLGISKGAFYHYFKSKPDLLEGLVDQMMEEALLVIEPVADDPSMNAMEKLKQYFLRASVWKTDQIEYLIPIFKVWYQDENVLVREKALVATLRSIIPSLSKIIRQGVDEGVFNTTYPDCLAEVVYILFYGMGNTLSKSLILKPDEIFDEGKFYSSVQVYSTSLDRILGVPDGSLEIINMDALKKWIPAILAQPNGQKY